MTISGSRVGEELGAASPVRRRASAGRWLVLLVLAAATLGLFLVVSNGFTALADVIAPLTGHLMGLGLAASLAAALSASQALAADRRHGADDRPAWLAGARALLPGTATGGAIGTDPGGTDQGRHARIGTQPHGARAQHLAFPRRSAAPRAIPGNSPCRRRRAVGVRAGQAAAARAISRPPIPSRSTAPSGRARWRCFRVFPSKPPGSRASLPISRPSSGRGSAAR